MKEFDYIIIGGGCAGLSLAYELEINDQLKDKTLAIVEPRKKYERDKTWSFWKVFEHNFEESDLIEPDETYVSFNTIFGLNNIKLMIPFCRTLEEAHSVIDVLEEKISILDY